MIDELPAVRRSAALLVSRLQERICACVLATSSARSPNARPAAGRGVFGRRVGERRPARSIGGSGSTRVIADGAVFEKGGVNTSIVTGSALPPSVVAQRPGIARATDFSQPA